jgi:hypothetical protein
MTIFNSTVAVAATRDGSFLPNPEQERRWSERTRSRYLIGYASEKKQSVSPSSLYVVVAVE